MVAIANETLSLKFPKGKFDDFYLYDLTVTEGISELYRADALVLSERPYTVEQLNEALSLEATVTIAQRLEDGRTKRSRRLHGVVTEIEHDGVFYSSDKTDCFAYRLTIEPELAALRHVVRKVSYNGKTPLDVVSELLADRGLTARFVEDYVSKRPFVSDCVYNQESSDFAFLKRLTAMYGLSFAFRHANADSGRAELYFSSGECFPDNAEIAYSDGRVPAATEEFDFRKSDESRNLWRMKSFSMKRRQGIDGVALIETYPDSNVGSDKWKAGAVGAGDRRRVYTRHFHNYVRAIPRDKVDADVDLILRAKLRAFQIERDVWKGSADNLLLMPCKLFRLARFYGGGNAATVSGMVTKSVLRCRAEWPQSMTMPPEARGETGRIEVTFEAMNRSDPANSRFCPFVPEE